MTPEEASENLRRIDPHRELCQDDYETLRESRRVLAAKYTDRPWKVVENCLASDAAADAILTAAAPDLLKACKVALRIVTARETESMRPELLKLLHAAIEKAEGAD